MPDSEKAKKPKKKGLEEAADVAVGPTGEQVLAEVRDSIEQAITAAQQDGVPVFAGGATVSLHLEYDDVTTPIDAVNQALTELALNGLRGYTFLVRDESTQELYAVQGGKMLLLPQDEQ